MNMEFSALTTTKLGELAEKFYVNEFVVNKGYTPYTPSIVNISHPIDVTCFTGPNHIWSLDVKAKSRRIKGDTGIDTRDYYSYNSSKKPVYVLWADILEKKLYGNWLRKLTATFEGNIVYFPLTEMIFYRDMTEFEHTSLKKLENSNYYD